jgi:hypothetical protein
MQREIAMLQAQLDRVTSRMHELEQLIWEDRGVAPDILLQRLRERERVRALDKGLTPDDLSGDSSSRPWARWPDDN